MQAQRDCKAVAWLKPDSWCACYTDWLACCRNDGWSVCVVYCLDAHFITDAAKYISGAVQVSIRPTVVHSSHHGQTMRCASPVKGGASCKVMIVGAGVCEPQKHCNPCFEAGAGGVVYYTAWRPIRCRHSKHFLATACGCVCFLLPIRLALRSTRPNQTSCGTVTQPKLSPL